MPPEEGEQLLDLWVAQSSARPSRLATDALARTRFPTAFRGYDPQHVRAFLEGVADEIREARDREAALRAQLEDLETKLEAAKHLDEAQLTAALGEETARVLLAAREAAAEIRAKAEESVAGLLAAAQEDATRIRGEAETVLAQKTKEAEEAGTALRAAVEAEVEQIREETVAAATEVRAHAAAEAEAAATLVEETKARAEAEAAAVVEAAKAHGREMVDEALLVRARVLDDLSRKRKAARVQLERLQAGRDRLLESYEIVRGTLDQATDELKGSLGAAKRDADTAARRVEIEPADTIEQLEAEVEAARDAGLPLVEEPVDETPFEGELPEGEMEPIVPSADFEEVRVIETEPEPEADDVVVEEVVVVEEIIVVDEEPETEPPVDVDDLFARIREARAEEVAKAREVLAEDEPAEGPEVEAAAEDDVAPAAPAPDEQALLERRDAVTDDAEQKATRKLKRVLADEQNEVLDRLRRNAKAKIAELFPEPSEHAARYADAASPALADAAAGGARFYDDKGRAGAVTDLANDLGEALALPLRDRVEASLREAAGDEEALADGVRAAYRDWKTHRIGMQTRDSVFAAFNRGLYDAVSSGTQLRWLIDDGGSPCPDAEDNSLAGLVTKGEPYPTGHCYPPAHPGCRCLLVPSTN